MSARGRLLLAAAGLLALAAACSFTTSTRPMLGCPFEPLDVGDEAQLSYLGDANHPETYERWEIEGPGSGAAAGPNRFDYTAVAPGDVAVTAVEGSFLLLWGLIPISIQEVRAECRFSVRGAAASASPAGSAAAGELVPYTVALVNTETSGIVRSTGQEWNATWELVLPCAGGRCDGEFIFHPPSGRRAAMRFDAATETFHAQWEIGAQQHAVALAVTAWDSTGPAELRIEWEWKEPTFRRFWEGTGVRER